MKILKITALFLLSFSILFTSCEPENIDTTTETKEVEDRTENKLVSRSNPVNGEGILLGCVAIPYPFSMSTINENVVEINSEDDFISALEDTVDYITDFIYPLTIVVDEEETTAASTEELGEIFAECIPDEGWSQEDFPAYLIDETYCVSLVYPFNVTDIEDNVIEVDSETNFIDLLAEYEILFYEFPLSVSDNETGEITEINSEAEFFDALLNCSQNNPQGDTISWGGEIACFEIVFPVSVILEDGTIVEVADENELTVLQLEHNVVTFTYPLTVVNIETGIEYIVESEQQLFALLIECFGDIEFAFPVDPIYEQHGTCYDIVFPVTVITNFVDENTVETAEELEAFLGQNAEIKAPFNIELPDGSILEVSTQTLFEFVTILENC
jgi:hypothetical protein